MKHRTLTLTLTAGLLLLAAAALAQPPKAPRSERNWRQMRDPHQMTEAFRLYKLTEYLELSEDQTAKIFPRMAALSKQQDEAREQIQAKQSELRELVEKEDWKKAASLSDEIFAMKGKQMSVHHEAMGDLRKLLSEEQRAKFQLFERRFQGHLEQMNDRLHQRRMAPKGPMSPCPPNCVGDDDDAPPMRGPRGGR